MLGKRLHIQCKKKKETIVSDFSLYTAIKKPYECMAKFRGFGKVLKQNIYLQIGKYLTVESCNIASLGHCASSGS